MLLFYVELLVLINLSFQQSNINNIVFDLADLAIDFEVDSGWISLEAFKSSLNDNIINAKQKEKYGQLNWLSIGYPKLVLSSSINSGSSSIFTFLPEGFFVKVDMLTSQHRILFKDVVKRKYGIDVKAEQIVSMIPSSLECSVSFYQNDEKFLINGRVNQMNTFPYRIFFTAPIKSKERVAFEKRLAASKTNLDLEFFCDVSSQGKTMRENTLIITGRQIDQLQLVDNLFGEGSEVYVTRTQANTLASEIYMKLNIIEDYQIAETQFTQDFVNDFIRLTASSIFSPVNTTIALSQLSPYDVSFDLKPNEITKQLSKVFYVNKLGTKEILQLNTTHLEILRKSYGKNLGGSASFSFAGINIGGSGNYASSQSSEWINNNTTFLNQLSQLNTYSENEVEWSREGTVIVPKNIKVSRLSKGSFSKDLVFSRIKRVYQEAPYKRAFTLNTFNEIQQTAFFSDYTKRLNDLENSINTLKTSSLTQNNNFEKNQNETKLSLIQQINLLNTSLITQFQKEIKISSDNLNLNIINSISSFDYTVNIQKGVWTFIGGVRAPYKVSMTSNFSRRFKRVPTVFYTIKTYHIHNNVAGLFKILNEQISTTSLSADFDMYGVFIIREFQIEWVAIGY